MIYLGVLVLALGRESAGAQVKKQTSAPTPGYLKRSTPPNLRFAPPPKPPVASLPPTAIPTDLPLVLSDKFLEKGDSVGRPPSDHADADNPGGVEGNGNGFSKKRGNGKPTVVKAPPRQSEGELLKLLVKYFEPGHSGAASTNDSLRFLPPVKKEIVVPLEPDAASEK